MEIPHSHCLTPRETIECEAESNAHQRGHILENSRGKLLGTLPAVVPIADKGGVVHAREDFVIGGM